MELHPAELELDLADAGRASLAQRTAREADNFVAETTRDGGPSLEPRSAQEIDLNGRGSRVGVVHDIKDIMRAAWKTLTCARVASRRARRVS